MGIGLQTGLQPGTLVSSDLLRVRFSCLSSSCELLAVQLKDTTYKSAETWRAVGVNYPAYAARRPSKKT